MPVTDIDPAERLTVRSLGLQDYEPLWRSMQRFAADRSSDSVDEIWFTEHPPVFTLGLNAAREHLLRPGNVPVIQVDRGGQVTYHGPGQLMIYPLIDLRRAGLGVRDAVTALERAAIDTLAGYGISAVCRRNAPGVYVDDRKIASVGLRIRRGSTYHGMAFNAAMDLEPFSRINPCGYRDLEVIDLKSLGIERSPAALREDCLRPLLARLGLAARRIDVVRETDT